MVMRMINSNVPSFEALGLPTSTAEMAMLKRSLVLVVGAAGSAKSVTEISELMQRWRLSEIKNAMSKGNEEGIVTFDQSLYALYQAGKITAEEAISNADSTTDLSLRIRLSLRHKFGDSPTIAMENLSKKDV